MFQAMDAQGHLHHLLIDPLPQGEVFFCPSCHQTLLLKCGPKVRPHFAHQPGQSCDFASLNEGAEHLNLKAKLFDWARKNEKVAVEVANSEAGIVSDLLLSENLALEVQCSPLGQDEFERRTRAYQDLGISVVWLLGSRHFLKRRLTALQRNILQFSSTCGYFFWNLDVENEGLILHYLLHQDLHGTCQGLMKVFPFFQQPLREVLRWPYKQKQVFSFQGRVDFDFPLYLAKELRYRNSFWIDQQFQAYLAGENLLNRSLADWYPQILPVKPGTSCRPQYDLERDYVELFTAFYAQERNIHKQVLYSPFYYRKECDKIGTLEESYE